MAEPSGSSWNSRHTGALMCLTLRDLHSGLDDTSTRLHWFHFFFFTWMSAGFGWIAQPNFYPAFQRQNKSTGIKIIQFGQFECRIGFCDCGCIWSALTLTTMKLLPPEVFYCICSSHLPLTLLICRMITWLENFTLLRYPKFFALSFFYIYKCKKIAVSYEFCMKSFWCLTDCKLEDKLTWDLSYSRIHELCSRAEPMNYAMYDANV